MKFSNCYSKYFWCFGYSRKILTFCYQKYHNLLQAQDESIFT